MGGIITKRHLGILFSLAGAIGIVAILIWDAIRSRPISNIQWAALAGLATLLIVGLTLLPLGDRPA
jgi:hypothetical protein